MFRRCCRPHLCEVRVKRRPSLAQGRAHSSGRGFQGVEPPHGRLRQPLLASRCCPCRASFLTARWRLFIFIASVREVLARAHPGPGSTGFPPCTGVRPSPAHTGPQVVRSPQCPLRDLEILRAGGRRAGRGLPPEFHLALSRFCLTGLAAL